MEDESLIHGTVNLQRRRNAVTTLQARPHYVEAPSQGIVEESSPGLLLEYFDIVRRHKVALILCASVGLLTSFLLTLPQKPVYQARASLEIRDLNENFLNMRDVNPTTDDPGQSTAESDLQTQVKILQSDTVLEGVIAKLDLEKKLSQQKERGGLFTWVRALRSKPASPREETLRLVNKNLTVKTEVNTRLVDVYYDSTNPTLAADFVNTLTAEFIQQNVEARWKVTQQTGDWLNNEMAGVRSKLEASEDALQEYAHSSGLLFTTEKVGTQLLEDNVDQEKLRELQEELSAAHGERVTKQSMYEMASTAPPESLPQVLDDKTLGQYEVKLIDLRRELADLSSSLTPANPSVIKVQAEVNTLESAVEKERSDDVRRIRNEYESAQRHENMLAANYAGQASLVSDQAAKVAHYNILKSDVDSNRQLYDSMLRSVQEAGMTAALRASNIRVVDPAVAPTRPYKPSLISNSVLGLFAGAIFGFVFVIVRDRADRSIQRPGEATLSLGLPELGVIPSLNAERNRFLDYYPKRRSTKSLELKSKAVSPRVELVTSGRSISVLSDCFRAAATSILYAGENDHSPRVLVLTSPSPGEGKTTVASNLALALAEIGSSVLLIDGDLRKGRLHEIFQVSNSWGLSDLLAGKEPPEDGRMYFDTGYQHLSLLPSGSMPSSIAGLLHSSQTLEFLNSARLQFHTIIIDTPPMLVMPDARVFGRLADGVILVVRSAETTENEAATAAQRLREDGSCVLGTILNEWNPRKSSQYGYAAAYHYDYHHSKKVS